METIKYTRFRKNIGTDTFHFIKPCDPENIVESYLVENALNDDEYIPYWVDHWPSAEVALEILPDYLGHSSKKICELGCGLGILSVFLASCSHDVLATDYSVDSCIITQKNFRENKLEGQVAAFDWRHSCLKGHFDSIIGTDILYEKRWIVPIADLLARNLNQNGTAYILDPGRPHLTDFEDHLTSRRFHVQKTIHTSFATPADITLLAVTKG
ncbi:MAG: class I SAM-dependent methyltransferase [Fibrobacterota bacterium]